jgi:hypothetical protein
VAHKPYEIRFCSQSTIRFIGDAILVRNYSDKSNAGGSAGLLGKTVERLTPQYLNLKSSWAAARLSPSPVLNSSTTVGRALRNCANR